MKYWQSILLLLALEFGLMLPSVTWADQKDNQSEVKDSNPPVAQSVGPILDAATEERFKILESKIDQLEKQNAKLESERDNKVDARLDDLAEQVSYNYPDAYEKAGLNLTVIGTYMTIAVTLAGVVYAFITLARTRTTNRNDARKQAIEVVNGINNFLTGRFSSNIALILSEIAWDREKNYAQLSPHLTTVAVRYQKDSYEAFRKKSCPEFQDEISEWTLKSLNNLIFMLSTTPSHPECAHINQYLMELRSRSEFWKHTITVNTYAFALMVFRDDLAQKRNVPVTQIMDEVRDLLTLQKSKDLTQSSLKELNRLIKLYDRVQGTQDMLRREGRPSAETGPAAQTTPKVDDAPRSEGTP